MENGLKFCQSCGMPLSPEVLGTNADGSKGTNNLRDDQLVPAGIDMEACHRKCVTLLR